MSEDNFQDRFLEFIGTKKTTSTFVPKLPMRYSIGKYTKYKEFGMPDFEIDIIEIDENLNFHLWELKLLNNSEIWNGKVFGQMAVYDFLFTSEPWTELFGRFVTKYNSANHKIVGDIEHINRAIMNLSTDENTVYAEGSDDEIIDSDAAAKFSSWNLLICGGKGYELAAGYNPMIWSLDIISETYLSDKTPELTIWQFYEIGQNNFELTKMTEQSILNSNPGLTNNSLKGFKEDHNDWQEWIEYDAI